MIYVAYDVLIQLTHPHERHKAVTMKVVGSIRLLVIIQATSISGWQKACLMTLPIKS